MRPAFTNKEVWIGGMGGVPLSRVEAWLARVWDALVGSLQDVGAEVPTDLLSSRVVGGDDLD